MGEHAVLPPSSAEQWGNCTGSVSAQANSPNFDTPESREGTAAHWVFSESIALFRREPGLDRSTLCGQFFEGRASPVGVLIDHKIVEGAQIMVDDVLDVALEYNALDRLQIEHRVHMPRIHTMNWGTFDAALYLPELALLHHWDYKHGHRECPAEGNLQSIDYLNGIAEEFGINGAVDQHTRVISRIVQPFCYRRGGIGPIDEWSFLLSDLRPYWNRLAMKAEEVFRAPTMSTGLWCRDCRAVLTCSAVRLAGYNFVDLVGAPYHLDHMTGADLAGEREILTDGLAVAKARLEAIEEDLQHRIARGETDSGLVLQSTPGRLEWTVPPEQALALGAQFGVDISKEAVVTPTQAIEAMPKEVRALFKQISSKFTRRPSGALQLVKAKNSRGARAFKRK